MITPEQSLPLTRKEAKYFGKKYYFTNQPCKRGHVAIRYSYNGACSECHKIFKKNYHASELGKEAGRRHYRENKDTILNKQILLRYKISLEQYNKILKSQNGVCAICGGIEKRIIRNALSRLCVDHCHDTKNVRGLLCHDCNTGLGKFRSNEKFLENAIKYLKERK